MSSVSSSSTVTPSLIPALPLAPIDPSDKIHVTPALLRSIFASSRTPNEERSISRIAFFRFTGFVLSCLCISMIGAKMRGARNLGVM